MKTLLRYETEAADIYATLKKIPRTGWVIRGVEHPETVYDHTISLLQLANDLAQDLQLNPAELNDLTHILEVHDWAEAIVGDEVIFEENPDEFKAKKAIKRERELTAMQSLCEGKTYGPAALTAFKRYESGADKVARIAKELDKYQALELALTYEESQGILLFGKFYEYYKRDWPFSHPVLLDQIDALHKRHSNLEHKK